MKIQDLPLEDRPREKAIKYGVETLSNEELIALIIGGGTKEKNATELAASLISETGGIKGLLTSSYQQIKRLKGIGKTKALRLTVINVLIKRYSNCTFENGSKTKYFLKSNLTEYQKLVSFDSQEKLYLIIVNKYKRVLNEIELYKGTSNSINISFRDICRYIYLNNGYGFYLIHTHPHSVSLPSKEDIETTKKIKEKAKQVGIKFIDHYVVNCAGYFSINDFLI